MHEDEKLVHQIVAAAGQPDEQARLIDDLITRRRFTAGEAVTLHVRLHALADRRAHAGDYLALLGIEDPLGRL